MCVLSFVAGAIAGFAATYVYMNHQNETQIEDTQMTDISNDVTANKEPSDILTQPNDVEKRIAYSNSIHTHCSMLKNPIDPEDADYIVAENDIDHPLEDAPYVISPEEFSDGEYEKISLTYYEGDGVLADDMDNVVDPKITVGADFSNHLGDYEEDCGFFRNEERRVDYEVLVDMRNYSDIVDD